MGAPVVSPTENTMFLSPVDGYEVNRIIKNLKNKRSHGIDELPPLLIKHCADELTLPFYLLINQSFEEGLFRILLDMTKAYDKVKFKILLNKLHGIGIRGNALKWLSPI
ncbi:hypothetical protein SFRURICE_010227 [Spodoptera frugiperda]|nr:hypothetical protein SFRURICE_010227 [Spodoptera frugiperda]